MGAVGQSADWEETTLESAYWKPGPAYRDAYSAAERPTGTSPLSTFFVLGSCSLSVRRLDEARAFLARSSTPECPPLARARTLLGFSALNAHLENPVALAQSRVGLELVRRHGDDVAIGRALARLALNLGRLGRDRDALGHLDEALHLLPHNGDRYHYTATLARAVSLATNGRWADARKTLDAARAMVAPESVALARFYWASTPIWAAAGRPAVDAAEIAANLGRAFDLMLDADQVLDAALLAADLADVWFQAGEPSRATEAAWWAGRVIAATREESLIRSVSQRLRESAIRGALSVSEVCRFRTMLRSLFYEP